jgi:hypothetical protein
MILDVLVQQQQMNTLHILKQTMHLLEDPPIFLKEPTIDQTVQILKNLRPILEAHHSVNI